MEITVLEKPGEFSSKTFNVNLERALVELRSELTASIRLKGFSRNGWARIEVSGEDSEILVELIAKKFGRAHMDLQEIEIGGVYEAVVKGSSNSGLEFDVGIEEPDHLRCSIPVSTLRAQLTDGKTISCRDITEDYCLHPGVRIPVRITEKREDEVGAWLSDTQIDRFSDWITTRLDRILVFDCFKQEAESAVLKANLTRDIIFVNPITLTVQSVVCKLGTDAIGLIPKLGRALQRRGLRPFIPKRITARCRPW
jgi:hypothetical protein